MLASVLGMVPLVGTPDDNRICALFLMIHATRYTASGGS